MRIAAQLLQVKQGSSASPEIGPVSQLSRGLAVLEALAHGPQNAASVARRLNVNRSTSLRLLEELRGLGYVARDAETKVYNRVSARLWALTAGGPDHLDWSEIIDPILEDARTEFGEATLLGVPANGAMVYLAFFSSLHPVSVSERLGTVRSMHSSGIGKAYLASLDPRALDFELGTITYTGGTDRAARGPMELRDRLVECRQQGYAVDRDETAIGATCVAAPVWIGDSLIGAAGISGPTSRLPEDRIKAAGEYLLARLTLLRAPG